MGSLVFSPAQRANLGRDQRQLGKVGIALPDDVLRAAQDPQLGAGGQSFPVAGHCAGETPEVTALSRRTIGGASASSSEATRSETTPENL